MSVLNRWPAVLRQCYPFVSAVHLEMVSDKSQPGSEAAVVARRYWCCGRLGSEDSNLQPDNRGDCAGVCANMRPTRVAARDRKESGRSRGGR